ncbi:MAG: DHH family phosphoesterase, partial [Rickettsiales bacterium]|nr:DHH family phosphoesterase [Rickettsiales bacterium]
MEILTATDEKLRIDKSVNRVRWVQRTCDESVASALSRQFDLPDFIARILSMRGIGMDDAEAFLRPTLRDALPDPTHLLDMETAVARIVAAVQQQQKVVIYGDYDVDGATSSALLNRFFAMAGLDVNVYIPDRMTEGYGPNADAFRKLQEQGVQLVITVDCGTVSFEPIAAANALGMDVVVIDHHLGAENLPDAVAVVNPNRLDETSPLRYLAAVGLSFMLAVAVNRQLREAGWYDDKDEPDLLSLLDLVALGTVCDVMPLVGLNRAFVTQGLKIMQQRRNIGLKALADVARQDGPPTVYHAGFVLGPRINAGGRIGKANLGTRLLSTEDQEEAHAIAGELDRLNEERRAIE